nr:MAG TPA: hypothetical protein [Caudoviricetes sp.]
MFLPWLNINTPQLKSQALFLARLIFFLTFSRSSFNIVDTGR